MAERRVRLRDEEIAASIVDGEALIINLSNGVYYSLPGSGGLMWAHLEWGHDTTATAAAVADRYGIELARALADLDALVDQLIEEGLVVADDELAGEPPPLDDGFPAPGAYEPPILERYADMADLLALDPPMPSITSRPWESADEPGPSA
ncbi:MAG TPA: PqqD family protein [Acidimicrobiia bacterium]|nr:PqqD family protein [Acidimicrobiia bacterium]